MKIPVVYGDHYIFYFENVQGNTVLHCDCFKWTKSVKESLLSDFNTLTNLHRSDIYYFTNPENTKLKKLGAMLGFTFFKDFIGTDGNQYQLFVRRF